MKLANDGIKTPPIKIKAGPQRISASFLQKFDGPIEDEYRMVEQSLVDVSAGTIPGMTTLPHLHDSQITGPMNVAGVSDTPSRRKIFTCRPARRRRNSRAPRRSSRALARQAYRRPVTDNDLEELLSFYQPGRNEGEFRIRNPHRDPGHHRQPGIRLPLRAHARRRRAGQELSASAIWNWPRACRISCGAARPTIN